ncbi:Activator of Hsp90 ATPase 1 family protein [Beutenbergia cavernae DSM 12333]|uniref:Activator of Hsp90 ATPase 1 family protein n=1 Tax=Beutenbergia cavernae (strain ATCC BAA-8 / DSM 12333 / CCUG 43141 / JCM 11478 / NBRC 16432 / NCIMB 13614 / HKI 0122) TaxID=471853 RepID=C5C3M7_BEUC1|nr:SRPBCC family protein [Beutenbergia cavernae]ACQ81936.1 Activator of Hsp90 ATPase 1 family protein [Beutenbergia cavernae DSM 12333]
MTTTIDPIEQARLVTREVHTAEKDGATTKIAVARRAYAAEPADVWDALTMPERLPRWFLPVSGDLTVGGRYQFEGNAGGVVEACERPDRFDVTWEFGGGVSWLTVTLTPDDGGTVLELRHEAVVDPDMWEEFGPGAVGLGWDGALRGLGLHLDSGAGLDPEAVMAWVLSPEGVAFHRAAGEDWERADVADGADPAVAHTASERAIAFYTTMPEEAPAGDDGASGSEGETPAR